MSLRFGVLLFWSIFAACVGVGVESSWWSGSGGFWRAWCVGSRFLWICRLAELRSFARRLICLLSEFLRGVCSLSGSVGGLV
jgi:hypothetical protein